MHKFFVESKLITEGDFQACWPTPDLTAPPTKTVDPFIQNLAERQIMPLDKSLKLLADRSRLAYIPLDRYEMDMDLVRTAPRASLPALVRAAGGPDEQDDDGRHRQSFQQTSRS